MNSKMNLLSEVAFVANTPAMAELDEQMSLQGDMDRDQDHSILCDSIPAALRHFAPSFDIQIFLSSVDQLRDADRSGVRVADKEAEIVQALVTEITKARLKAQSAQQHLCRSSRNTFTLEDGVPHVQTSSSWLHCCCARA